MARYDLAAESELPAESDFVRPRMFLLPGIDLACAHHPILRAIIQCSDLSKYGRLRTPSDEEYLVTMLQVGGRRADTNLVRGECPSLCVYLFFQSVRYFKS